MSTKSQEEMIRELYQCVIGLPDNPADNGLIGDIDDIKKLMVGQANYVTENTRNIAITIRRVDALERDLVKIVAEGVPIRFTRKQYSAAIAGGLTIFTTLVTTAAKALGWF